MTSNHTSSSTSLQFLGLDPQRAKKYSKWLKFEAILLIVLGMLAIIIPGLFSLASIIFVGWLFLIGGTVNAIGSFQAMRSRGFAWRLTSAILMLVAGILIITRPLEGILVLTLLVAIYYGVDGIFKIIHGIQISKTPGSGMMIINGIFGLIIALIVYWEWPLSAVWFLGIIIGVNLIFSGFFLLRLNSAIKQASD